MFTLRYNPLMSGKYLISAWRKPFVSQHRPLYIHSVNRSFSSSTDRKREQVLNDKFLKIIDTKNWFEGVKDMDAALRCLDDGADVNYRSESDTTALTDLSVWDCITEIRQLLNRGALVDLPGTKNETALIKASRYGHSRAVKLLLDHGANVNYITERGGALTVTKNLSVSKSLPVIELLIKHGIDVNQGTSSGETKLHSACKYGEVSIVKLLLKSGDDVNARCDGGKTPLMEAVYVNDTLGMYYDKKKIIKLLIEHGAALELKDKDQRTAYQNAKSRSIIELLDSYRNDEHLSLL